MLLPKKTKVTSINIYRPVSLTHIAIKSLEKLVTNSIIPDSSDPHQFAYRPNRSADDAISLALHIALEHLDRRDTYVRLLLIDFSSAFNTIFPSKLILKLRDLGLGTPICNWMMEVVTIGSNTSSTLVLNTGAPQVFCLSPRLYSFHT